MPPARAGARPLHLLLVSNIESPPYVQGADRDWVNILNALGPASVRVTWGGVSGVETLRGHLDARVVTRLLDLDFLPFSEFFHAEQYRRRTPRNWAGITAAQARRLLPALRRLRRALRGDPPDVVVTNTSVVLPGAAYALTARLPHVWCVKEFIDPSAPGGRRYARLIERLSDAVVVPSRAMAAPFGPRARVLRDGSDVAAVRAGVRDADRARVLGALGLPPGLPVVAQVGAVSEAKGQHVTAAAFARLAAAGARPFSLLFLGYAAGGPKEKVLAALSGSPEEWRARVRFSEFAAGDFSLLAAADVVAHPSVIPDPYPNAVREALALGKPVVGARAGGVVELVSDGETGLLVEPGDAAGLAGALARLLWSAEERARMGAAARRFAEGELDVRVCARAFLELLRGVAARRV